MGICGGKQVGTGAAPSTASDPAPVTEIKFTQEQIKALHSRVRWQKPLEEIKACVVGKGIVNSSDEQNGNTAIHIAAQNGYLTILEYLISAGGDVNKQNKTGTTALHMSQEYGFFWVSQALIKGGANEELKNNNGFAAKTGIEGGISVTSPDYWVSAITSASTKEQIYEGIKMCTDNKNTTKKDKFVLGYMTFKKNKDNKLLWEKQMSALCAALAKSDGWKAGN